MSLALASGAEAADALEARCRRAGTEWCRAGGHVVSWPTESPWIDVHDDGSVVVVVDGRLHNGPAGPSGHAEFVARRYRTTHRGVGRGLLGDFVAVVLDRPAMELLVVRDPVGVRPWYQAAVAGGSFGASEVSVLLDLPGLDTSLDEQVAIEYLAALSQSRGATLHAGITTLRPGHTWYADAYGGGQAFAHHTWTVTDDSRVSWTDALERCRSLLDDAVAARVAVSGPIGAELSGGLDSSAVVGTAVRRGAAHLLAGRLLFEGARADERSYSDAVAAYWNVELVSVPPWLPSEAEYEALTVRLGRPPPDPNFTMFASLHDALRQRGSMDSLTGLGGDDAFAAVGVPARMLSLLQLRQWAALNPVVRHGLRHPKQLWSGVVAPTARYRRGRYGAAPPSWVSATAARTAGLQELLYERARPVAGVAGVDERLVGLTSGYDARILEDRALLGDVSGRRDSHPFLDPRFIEGTYGLDPAWPLRDGRDRSLHVAAYADRLPPEVLARTSKAEFSQVVWAQMLDPQIMHAVATGPLAELGWLDPSGFARLVESAMQSRANAALPLSRCVALDRWLRLTAH
ncbi:MAG: hypothetical protein QOG49_440 [Frankiaceae bacterium]|nr:hypothetical protein [Frankiaceae bacterium]